MTTVSTRNVLVVEDDQEIQYLLAEFLADEGYTVHTADHGQAALSYLTTAPTLPCSIVSDLMMPLMDGWTLCRTLQHQPQFASIPVIILSAVDNLSRGAQSLGVAAAVPKPIDLTMLLTTIERVSLRP